MNYFLSSKALSLGELVTLEGEEATHIRGARRMRPGEVFALQDPLGSRFSVELMPHSGRKVIVRILAEAEIPALPALQLTCLQAVVKEKALEDVLRQITELGVRRLILFRSDHASGHDKAIMSPRFRDRWTRIAWEACKQCGRASPPEIDVVDNLDDVLAGIAATGAPAWLLQPQDGMNPREAMGMPASDAAPTRGWIAVGPEGGFSGAEAARFIEAGMTPVTLPGPTLRAHTAAVIGCGLMLHGRWGDG